MAKIVIYSTDSAGIPLIRSFIVAEEFSDDVLIRKGEMTLSPLSMDPSELDTWKKNVVVDIRK